MQLRIAVTAGPSLDETTQQCIHVNSETYVPISNEHFTGQITVRVKDFAGVAPDGQEPISQSPYFTNEAPNMTFSIEASGLYTTENLNADDLLFGIVFRQSIIERLPSSYPLGIKALHWFNPNIDFQLEGDRPTVLAPLLSIMSRVTVTPTSTTSTETLSSSSRAVNSREEDTTVLLAAQDPDSRARGDRETDKAVAQAMLPLNHADHKISRGWLGSQAYENPAKARQHWFSDPEVRKETVIGHDCITTDLQNGFMDFKDMSMRLPGLPFTVSLGQYMKGRPVQYCCISRDKSKIYWCVVFTIIDDEQTDES